MFKKLNFYKAKFNLKFCNWFHISIDSLEERINNFENSVTSYFGHSPDKTLQASNIRKDIFKYHEVSFLSGLISEGLDKSYYHFKFDKEEPYSFRNNYINEYCINYKEIDWSKKAVKKVDLFDFSENKSKIKEVYLHQSLKLKNEDITFKTYVFKPSDDWHNKKVFLEIYHNGEIVLEAMGLPINNAANYSNPQWKFYAKNIIYIKSLLWVIATKKTQEKYTSEWGIIDENHLKEMERKEVARKNQSDVNNSSYENFVKKKIK